jgi:hypothetical protein
MMVNIFLLRCHRYTTASPIQLRICNVLLANLYLDIESKVREYVTFLGSEHDFTMLATSE